MLIRTKFPLIITVLLFSSCILSSCFYKKSPQKTIYNPTINKQLITKEAMATSARIEASLIAKDIMKQGGNAVDAAIATHMALAVCYPVAGNLGGGGFMIVRMADGTIDALDFREVAPKQATKDMYLDTEGNAITTKSRLGHLAIGVPGSVDGMIKAYHKYSKLKDWKRLIQPAIDLADKGIIITKIQAKLLNKYQNLFQQTNQINNAFLKNTPWKNGDLLIQKDLAKTLERIRDQGRKGFYQGETADKIIAEMKRSNGIIKPEDLLQYQAVWRAPIVTDYRGYKVISMPPPSSGGIALSQLLEMVEPYNMNKLGWHTAESIHLMIEAERRVYADRSKHLGDIDFYPVPVNTLLQADYIQDRMNDYDPLKATLSEDINAGIIDAYQNESTETTHYSIVDPYGNAISVTTTLNGHFGSKVVVGNAGFFLNNEMDDFSAKPGVPNMFGLLGAEANKIEPRKRMLSSMTPTIVEKDNKLFLSLGTPGGATIITSVFQTLLNIIDHGMNAKEAISAKRFHHQWKPDIIKVESGVLTPSVQQKLESMGHHFKSVNSIGRVEAILVKTNKIEGAADPRADDDVEGY